MSETEGQRNDSPLLSERGVTTISDTVVSSLAGMAAQEVDGVHMGGGASRAAGGVLESLTGSESRTSGITVEVGRTEAAIDLKMGIEYNKNILQTIEEVRRRITERVEWMTGLRVKELNATITDVTFPEKEAKLRLGRAKPPSEPDKGAEETPATAPETRAAPEDEPGDPAETAEPETSQDETTGAETAEAETTEVESAEVETAEAETTGTSVEAAAQVETAEAEDSGTPEEEDAAPVEDSGVAEEATAEEQPAGASEAEDTGEAQTPPEPETPEERMRRRAQERARRRRRRGQEDD